MRHHAQTLSLFAALLVVSACIPPPQYGTTTTTQSAPVVANTGGGVQYLYVPTTNIATTAIQQVIVQTHDGRTFTLGPSDVRAVASGRMALAIPPGVTQGQVIIVANGITHQAIPFYVAQPVTTLVTTTTVISPQCLDISGTWTGNISESDPQAVATAVIQLGSDCRSVSGFIHWEGPRIGSVDSTITGVWDASSMTLIARDAQLFNVRPVPGGGFCPTEQYRLNLSPDGRTLTGLNIVTERTCAGQSNVYLRR
jgi:hypothetical protein